MVYFLYPEVVFSNYYPLPSPRSWRREKVFRQASCIWPSGRTAWRGWPKTLGIDSHAQEDMGKMMTQKNRCWNCWWNMKLRWTSTMWKKMCNTKSLFCAGIFLSHVRVHWPAIPLSSFPYLSIWTLCTETPDAFHAKEQAPRDFSMNISGCSSSERAS